MRQFNLKGEVLIEDPQNESPDPGRTNYPEKLWMAEPGWVIANYMPGDREVRLFDRSSRLLRKRSFCSATPPPSGAPQ